MAYSYIFNNNNVDIIIKITDIFTHCFVHVVVEPPEIGGTRCINEFGAYTELHEHMKEQRKEKKH